MVAPMSPVEGACLMTKSSSARTEPGIAGWELFMKSRYTERCLDWPHPLEIRTHRSSLYRALDYSLYEYKIHGIIEEFEPEMNAS